LFNYFQDHSFGIIDTCLLIYLPVYEQDQFLMSHRVVLYSKLDEDQPLRALHKI